MSRAELEVASVSDGSIRIIDYSTDPPRCLPRASANGHPLYRLTQAAVRAAPDAASDKDGLYWPNRASAEAALAAAKKAAKLYKL